MTQDPAPTRSRAVRPRASISRWAAAAVLAALLSSPVIAADAPTASYIEAAYVLAGNDEEGASLRGSGAISRWGLMQVDLHARGFDDGSVVDFRAGAGIRWPAAPGLEMSFLLTANISGGAYEGDSMADNGMNGIGLGGGAVLAARGRLTDSIEWRASAGGNTVLKSFAGSFGLRYSFSRRAAVGLDVVTDYWGARAELGFRIDLRRR